MNDEIVLQLNPATYLYTLKELNKHAIETKSFFSNLNVIVRSDIIDNIFDTKKIKLQLEQVNSDKSLSENENSINENIIYDLTITLPNEISGSITEINLFYKNNNQTNKDILLATYKDPVVITQDKTIVLHLTLYAIEMQETQSAPEWMKKAEIYNNNDNYLGEWSCEHFSEISSNLSRNIVPVANLIAGYNDREIYLIYVAKDQENSAVLFSVYEIFEQKHNVLKQLINTVKPINLRNGFLGKATRFEIKFYLIHKQGVYCFKTNIASNLTTSYNNQFVSEGYVPHSTTLANIGGNACLIGGALANNTSCVVAAGTSVLHENKHPMICHPWLLNGRNNPIVEYFDGNLYFIGGNVLEHQPLVELKQNFVNHINVHVPIVTNTIPTPKNIDYLKNINAVTHRHCHLKHQIYIFPYDLFRDESSVYFIYDTLQNEVYIEKIEKNLYKEIFEKNMAGYNSLQVVNVHDKSIYFILTYSTTTILKTLFIFSNKIAKNL
jgi:hypothetical protein